MLAIHPQIGETARKPVVSIKQSITPIKWVQTDCGEAGRLVTGCIGSQAPFTVGWTS